MAIINFGTAYVSISVRWTAFKSYATTKALQIQYVEDTTIYTIFALDQGVVYVTDIFKGTITNPDPNYSQSQNDTDKSDFETNYKTTANKAITTQTVTTHSASTATSTVALSVSNQTLLAANSVRLGATIFNDSGATLYVKLGAVATLTDFSVKLSTYAYYELPYNYRGQVDGIWDTALTGNARITELS